MKAVSKILWVEGMQVPTTFKITGSIHVFFWGPWQWRECFVNNTVRIEESPFEWPEFWAGVLDTLFLDTKGSLGQGLPRSAIVFWEKHPSSSFVRISLIRAMFSGPGNDLPPWFDNRPTRLERLLRDDDLT